MLKIKEHLGGAALVLVLTFFSNSSTAQTAIVPHGHSHNDYTRKRPLFHALANGFQSIEVDVFHYKGKLVVSHTHTFLFWKKTLEELYIRALDSIYKKQGKFFENDSAQLILYIDIKNKNDAVCADLIQLANEYSNLFTHWQNGEMYWAPVKLLSTCFHMEPDSFRFIQKNGSLDEIESDIPASVFPRVNSPYRAHFKWKGRGEMPKEQEKALENWVEKAHANNRQIRFWGAGNRTSLWKKLLEKNVDWINVDKLGKYRPDSLSTKYSPIQY